MKGGIGMNSIVKRITTASLAVLLLVTACILSPTPAKISSATAADDGSTVYDTWVATDALGRSLPTYEEAGATREGKQVGLFYFVCHDDPGDRAGDGTLIDNSKVFAEGGLFAVWEMMLQDQTHVWGEPYFGYYVNTDRWIYRKHAAMFAALGIDFVFLDLSNSNMHGEGVFILFEEWKKIRDEGGTTPQIALFCGHRASTARFTIDSTWERIYQNPEYDELIFKWEGKPLFLGSPADLTEEYKAFFTIRESWVGTGKSEEYTYTGINQWNWFDTYPQTVGKNLAGEKEHISVSAAGHANASTSRSWSGEGQAISAKDKDFGFSAGTSGDGIFFAQQWEYALEVDPMVVTITGWNEFLVGAQPALGNGQTMAGTYTVNFDDPQYDRHYIDLFNTEFSRDIEPINGFFGDNYYYQMAYYIRRFKGMNPLPTATGGKAIDLKGSADQWVSVGPLFADTLGDVTHRDAPSMENVYRYINTTGRNDIASVKVSRGDGKTTFRITCTTDITVGANGVNGRLGFDFTAAEAVAETPVKATAENVSAAGENWMNLFINADGDYTTGWNGYDYILNRSRDGSTVTVEKFVDNEWKFKTVGTAAYTLENNTLTVQVEDSLVGLTGRTTFDFKAADNSVTDGDILKFMTLGDTAPDNRFAFRYQE